MKIAKFIACTGATKDTIRHYEELKLILPKWEQHRRIYSESDIKDYEAIIEMKALGLTLKEIQSIFDLKRNHGCRSTELLQGLTARLYNAKSDLLKKEEQIREQKTLVTTLIEGLKSFIE